MAAVQEELRAAWHAFVVGNEDGLQMLRPIVRESWERCRRAGVNPYQKVVPNVLDPEALAMRREKNREWLEIARPVMETLYRFVAGSGFVVAVADCEGYLLEVIGDPEVVQAIAKGNFIPGADWSELSAGTNSVGTALIMNQPLQIFSYEHYCICSHRWTCSAAPIHDPDGNLIGVLDMTGSFEKVHPHTLGMVVAGADAIERQMAMKRAWRERDLANRVREALMESISEGILATDCNRRVIHMNQEAVRLLGTKKERAVGADVRKVLGGEGADWEAIVSGQKFITDRELDVTTPFGTVKLTVTSRPIRGNDGQCEGIVMVLNEITRARKLTQRMSGAVARLTFDDMVGEDPKFRESLRLARAAASSDSTVLLLGESGTGKDILAQAIHNASQRAKGPFVAINCGAIPRDLIGSELFGYTEGAFTGARKGGSPGKFELADGGTIFLDEIGDMPLELQTTLLRVLEQKAITRIGGSTVLPVNVRVIAATNRDLAAEVERGNFRRDLYYRLNVVTIRLVPLRERQGDIELLLWYFLERLGKQMGKHILSVDERVWPLVKAYPWPGNVRELQNVVERALHLAGGPTLRPEHLPEEIRRVQNNLQARKDLLPVPDYEKQVILKLLEENKGNLSRVANQLGIARTTLYRRMAKYGLRYDRDQYNRTNQW
ncbi:sigma-54-dependent Fis family transcriptional regulator [Desulfofundulus sp. TPOSR]|uniref:sigma-54-dependent Fis family transcriptional regulator n=1 Tax=Desulfofundulus sp. TPOSR TaxID=2714340 RepID=UPI0014088452|nr:sigma-54-dependent Fis family transcriptional regulator [Desulfofundulus sp. TPOSR]NHM25790.1 sigma-54-dependent Fis family transcriptional regulator [Desulfofundulus sp. TPOSR]